MSVISTNTSLKMHLCVLVLKGEFIIESLLSFTQTHVVPNLCDFVQEHKSKCLSECPNEIFPMKA